MPMIWKVNNAFIWTFFNFYHKILSFTVKLVFNGGSLWSWSYDNWIYNYLCNQCLSSLKLWIRIPLMARCTWYNFMWSSLSVTSHRLVTLTLYSTVTLQKKENWPYTTINSLFKIGWSTFSVTTDLCIKISESISMENSDCFVMLKRSAMIAYYCYWKTFHWKTLWSPCNFPVFL